MSVDVGNHRATPVDRVDKPPVPRPPSAARAGTSGRAALAARVTLLLMAAAASGSSSSDELSEAGQRGRGVANSSGCASCHGPDGQGGVGPKWTDLAGSEVTLSDGRVVVADDAYLTTAIVDPGAEFVAGFTVQMPTNALSDDEVADVIAYIKDLRSAGGADGG
jgi:cytochrome c oxidase subunit 2